MDVKAAKKELKRAREALAAKDFAGAVAITSDLLADVEPTLSSSTSSSVSSSSPETEVVYNALVFRGLAHANLIQSHVNSKDDHKALSLASYNRAVAMIPGNVLALQGLVNLFSNTANYQPETDKLLFCETLETLRGVYAANPDTRDKFASTSLKLITTLTTPTLSPQDTHALIKVIHELIPSLLSSPIPEPSESSQEPSHTPLSLSLLVIESQKNFDVWMIDKEFNIRRRRLGAGDPDTVKRNVEMEVYLASRLDQYCLDALHLPPPYIMDAETRVTILSTLISTLHKKLTVSPAGDKPRIRDMLIHWCCQCMNDKVPVAEAVDIVVGYRNVELEYHDINTMQFLSEAFDGQSIGYMSSSYLKYMAYIAEGKNRNVLDEVLQETLTATEGDAGSISPITYLILCHVYMDLSEFETVVHYGQTMKKKLIEFEARTTLPVDNLVASVDGLLATAYKNLGDVKSLASATSLFKSLVDRYPNHIKSLQGLASCHVLSENFGEALAFIDTILKQSPGHIEATSEHAWILYHQGSLEASRAAFENLISMIEHDIEDKSILGVVWYRLSRVYNSLGGEYVSDTSFMYKAIISSLRCHPTFAASFTAMGDYCRHVEKDITRALKCYSRARDLDERDAEAGLGMAECLVTLDKDSKMGEAMAVLNGIVDIAPRFGKGWRMLGVLQSIQGDHINAITSFQNALRVDVRDIMSWIGLGESYKETGKFMAALKALKRAVDLNDALSSSTALSPTTISPTRSSPSQPEREKLGSHALYLIACIQSQLGLLSDAVESFNTLIEKKRGLESVAIVSGCLETYMHMTKEAYQNGAFGLAVDYLNLGIHLLSRYSDGGRQTLTAGLMKWCGELCLGVKIYGSRHVDRINVDVLEKVVQSLGGNETEMATETMMKSQHDIVLDRVLKSGTQVFRVLIATVKHVEDMQNVMPDLWHDLSQIYFYRAELIRSISAKNGDELTRVAIRCVCAALKLAPAQDTYWNSLGIYLMKYQVAIAQHAFIKAAEFNLKSAVPWTHLGFLYIRHGDLDLAKQAFTRAQLIDPDWPLGWYGQALISRELGSSDAADLFDHAHELSQGSVNDISYTYALQTFKSLTSVSSSVDPSNYTAGLFALTQVIDSKPRDVAALNLLGLYHERRKEYRLAATAFEKCLAVLDEDGGKEEHVRNVLSALGRVLCGADMFDESAGIYERLFSMPISQKQTPQQEESDIYARIGAGLALYFGNRLEESLGSFQIALDLVGKEGCDDRLRNDLSLLLAQVLYALGSETHLELAKQQLFECIARSSDYPKAIMALCAFGMVTGDGELASSAASELMKKSPDILGYDLEFESQWLLSKLFLLQGGNGVKLARGFLSKAIHHSPWCAKRWSNISDLMNRYSSHSANTSLKTSLSALALSASYPRQFTTSPSLYSSTSLSTAQSAALTGQRSIHISKKRSKSLRSLLYTAIRAQPSNPNTWLAFASLSAPMNSTKSIGSICNIVQKLTPDPLSHLWCKFLPLFIPSSSSCHSGSTHVKEEIESIMKEAENIEGSEKIVLGCWIVLGRAEQDITAYCRAISGGGGIPVLQELSLLFMKIGHAQAANVCLRHALMCALSDDSKKGLYLSQFLCALSTGDYGLASNSLGEVTTRLRAGNTTDNTRVSSEVEQLCLYLQGLLLVYSGSGKAGKFLSGLRAEGGSGEGSSVLASLRAFVLGVFDRK